MSSWWSCLFEVISSSCLCSSLALIVWFISNYPFLSVLSVLLFIWEKSEQFPSLCYFLVVLVILDQTDEMWHKMKRKYISFFLVWSSGHFLSCLYELNINSLRVGTSRRGETCTREKPKQKSSWERGIAHHRGKRGRMRGKAGHSLRGEQTKCFKVLLIYCVVMCLFIVLLFEDVFSRAYITILEVSTILSKREGILKLEKSENKCRLHIEWKP